jgi:hypothetical protein
VENIKKNGGNMRELDINVCKVESVKKLHAKQEKL